MRPVWVSMERPFLKTNQTKTTTTTKSRKELKKTTRKERREQGRKEEREDREKRRKETGRAGNGKGRDLPSSVVRPEVCRPSSSCGSERNLSHTVSCLLVTAGDRCRS